LAPVLAAQTVLCFTGFSGVWKQAQCLPAHSQQKLATSGMLPVGVHIEKRNLKDL